jgi:hypothetical protein
MPDDFDFAQERQLELMENRLREFQYQLSQMGNIEEESACRNCKEPLLEGQHYCNSECRDDHWLRVKAEKRRGREL